MKTKITTIAFVTMLFVLPVSAQETYLPIFGEGTKFYCVANTGCDAPDSFGYFECSKDKDMENVYYIMKNGAHDIRYSTFEISEDNSKLWGHDAYTGDTDLLMDLNLIVGDKFNDFTVAKVYRKDERKHIEFEFEIHQLRAPCICSEDNFVCAEDFPLTFVEGVGPNFFLLGDGNAVWIYAKHKNGELEYGINGYPPKSTFYWIVEGLIGDYTYTCERTDVRDIKIRTLSLIPNPSGDKVLVTLPETIVKEATLTINDLSGRIIETIAIESNSFVLDISRYVPAIYTVKLGTDNGQYVGKIIKK